MPITFTPAYLQALREYVNSGQRLTPGEAHALFHEIDTLEAELLTMRSTYDLLKAELEKERAE